MPSAKDIFDSRLRGIQGTIAYAYPATAHDGKTRYIFGGPNPDGSSHIGATDGNTPGPPEGSFLEVYLDKSGEKAGRVGLTPIHFKGCEPKMGLVCSCPIAIVAAGERVRCTRLSSSRRVPAA